MEEYVQYHNTDRMGYWCEGEGDDGFEVVTNVRWAPKMVGKRIWLIGGDGKPRRYYLCYHFIVDWVEEETQGKFRYLLGGTRGRRFTPPILLNEFPWFRAFLRSQQNFRFGLRKIDEEFVDALYKVGGVSKLADGRSVLPVGAGFGDVVINRRVEESAVEVVSSSYKRLGWEVQSVEADRIGFDLLCVKGEEEEHVEVKGVKGEALAFFVTAGEAERARIDPNFTLCVVTEALTAPKMHCFSGREFLQKFALKPVTYRAEMKEAGK